MKIRITGHIISTKLPEWEEYKTKTGLEVCYLAFVEAIKGFVKKQITIELSTAPRKGFKKARFVGKGRGHSILLSRHDEKKLWKVLEANGTFWIPEAWREALNKMGRPKVFYWRVV